MINTVLLNPALDITYQLPELVPGSTRLDINLTQHPSGKSLNVARVVSILGEDVTLYGIMPEESAPQFTRYCERLRINARFMPVAGSIRINTTILEEETGHITHLNAASSAWPTRLEDEFFSFVKNEIQSGDTWAFSGSLPSGFDSGAYEKLITLCHQNKADTLLDSRGDGFKIGLRARPSLVKPNLAELEGFFDEHVEGVRHIVLKAKKLLDLGIPSVFVSLGPDGLIALNSTDCLLCSPPTVKVVDTVGSGDALVAGLLVGRARHFSFPEMCRMAVACGCSNAMHSGPGNVALDEVWRLMEDVKIENV